MSRPEIDPTPHFIFIPESAATRPEQQWSAYEVPCPREPLRLTTVLTTRDPNTPPSPDWEPVHHDTAFFEDRHHDWLWRASNGGILKYYSCAMGGNTWVAVYYAAKETK